jgi:hypothetical protein
MDASTPSPIEIGSLHNDTQRGLAISVNAILSSGLCGDEAWDRIVEDIQPAVLFHPHVRAHASLYREIRDILLFVGAPVERRRGYPVVKALANMYPEGELRNEALSYITPPPSQSTSGASQHTTEYTNSDIANDRRDEARAVSSLLSVYRDDYSKYGGTVKENFHEAFDKFERVVQDLGITPTKGLQVLHNMLTGEALSYFTSRRSECQTLADARTLLGSEFMSVTRQNSARRELDSLDFQTALGQASTPLEALESLRTTITRVITQCPLRYHGEKFKIDFLRRAIQGEDWAADPIARADGDDHSFTQFYNNVATRLALAAQNNSLIPKRHSVNLLPTSATRLPMPTLYGEQLTRTPPHRHQQRHSSASTPAGNRLNPAPTSRACFNCGSPDHLIAKCPRPRSLIKTARDRLRTTPAAVLLFEALDQLEIDATPAECEPADTINFAPQDEVNLFDTLLARSLEHRMAPATSSEGHHPSLNFQEGPPVPRHAEGTDLSDE